MMSAGPPPSIYALVQLFQDPQPYGARAVFMPTVKFTEDTCRNVYLGQMLGNAHVEKFGGRDAFLKEWKELYKGPPVADPVAWLQKVKGSALEWEQVFQNADNAEEARGKVKEALEGEEWEEWAVYKTGNGDVEHGAMFAGSLKSGGVFFLSFFSD